MRVFLTFFVFCISLAATAATTSAPTTQWKWYNPMDCGYDVVQNQGWTSEIGKTYNRMPDRAMKNVRGAVWNLSRHSAGLSVNFYTNAPEIKVRYVVNGPLDMHHMPSTGVSGLDLYGIDQNGCTRRFFGFFNGHDGCDTVVTRFVNDRVKEFHDRGYEFHMYLPLYNSVRQLEIGIPESSDLSFLPVSPERPVMVYGTSIEQGGVASRPGMAWTTILQRSLDYPLINLGFSGNGRLEKGVLDLMAETDARLYILACLANLCDATPQMVDSLTTNAVATLRARNDAPIILVEHPGFSDVPVNSAQAEIIDRLNTASKAVYKRLVDSGVKDLYYVSREDIAIPAEGWVDDVHPSDLGMSSFAAAVERVAREALNIPVGTISTTIPVTQRREPQHYEWRQRHRDVLARNKSNPPRSVIIGNSITNFWGGLPEGYVTNGPKTWKKYMEPAGFGNLGFGWDRIENALWRVYHDELDGYEADQVVLMIGTNNYTLDSDRDIVEGIRNLIHAVRVRQPKARIKVVGILPRRDAETWVAAINPQIEAMAAEESCEYVNPGVNMLLKNGKIDESLFTDGLHPNDKGYSRIVSDIIR